MAKTWTSDELLVVLGLYCQLPFGQFHSRNPLVQQVATHLQRTPGSVAMKLSNLASLDPIITGSGRKGLQGASALDREVWNAFSTDSLSMLPLAEQALQLALESSKQTTMHEAENVAAYQEDDHFANVKVRKGQKLFRDAVLTAYENRCCVTGVAEPRFLVASHIRPWRQDPENRLNPRNGLCLSLMIDKAFDLGLITFSEDYRLVLSAELKQHEKNPHIAETFFTRMGQPITLPSKFTPDQRFLAWHRESYFVGNPIR